MSVGIGIGSFMDGFSRGAGLGLTIKNQNEAREERARQRKLEDEDRKIASEDRQRRRQQEDYKWGRQLEADSREDRMRQVHADAVRDTEQAMARGLPQGVMQGQRPPAGDGKALPAMAPSMQAAQSIDRPGEFVNFYMKIGVPKIVKAYLEQGDVASAQAYQSWIETEGVKKGMKSWAKATHAAASGDDEGWFRHTIETYNTTGYFDDGYTAIREKSKLLRDKDGAIIGAQIAFKGPDGKEFVRKFDGIDDLYRASVQFMAPESVFQYGLDQVAAADKMRAEAATKADERAYDEEKAGKAHQRTLEQQAHASELRIAEEAQKRGLDPHKEETQELLKGARDLLRNDTTFKMTPAEAIQKSAETIELARQTAAAGATPPTVPAQRRVEPPGGRVR